MSRGEKKNNWIESDWIGLDGFVRLFWLGMDWDWVPVLGFLFIYLSSFHPVLLLLLLDVLLLGSQSRRVWSFDFFFFSGFGIWNLELVFGSMLMDVLILPFAVAFCLCLTRIYVLPFWERRKDWGSFFFPHTAFPFLHFFFLFLFFSFFCNHITPVSKKKRAR